MEKDKNLTVPPTERYLPLSKQNQKILYWIGEAKRMGRKQRIRIYRKSDEFEYYDVTKGLTAFNDKCISLQYIWCLTMGGKL